MNVRVRWIAMLFAVVSASTCSRPAPVLAPKPGAVEVLDPGADRPSDRRRALERWFGPPASEAVWQLRRKRVALERQRARRPGPAVRSLLSTTKDQWASLGPTTAPTTATSPDVDAGRLTGVVRIGADLYVASPGGGVWRTSAPDFDSTTPWTWTPITDGLDTSSGRGGVAVGAMAAPGGNRDTLYIGLGDWRDQARGGEVFWTTEASNNNASWNSTNLAGASFVLSMGLVTAAGTSNDTLMVGTNNGLYVGSPGNLVQNQRVCTCFVYSIQTDGSSKAVVSALRYVGDTAKAIIYTSSDSGATWTKATFDSAATAQNPQRMTLAMDPTDSSTVWAMAANTDETAITGLFKSSDGGASWTYQAATGLSDGLQYADSNQVLTVAPTDGSTIFFGVSGGFYRSTDGGSSFAQIADDDQEDGPYLHPDLHGAMWWNKSQNLRDPKWQLLVINDGGLGIFRIPFSDPPAKSGGKVPSDVTFLDNTRNAGLTILQAYAIGSTMAAGATELVGAGTQDNGTRLRMPQNGSLASSTLWGEVARCGDAFGTLLHPSNGNWMLAACSDTVVYQSQNATSAPPTFTDRHSPVIGSDGAPFFTRLVTGSDDNTVYTASNRFLFKSADFGTSWSTLAMSNYGDKDIRAFAVAKTDPTKMVIVADGDTLYTSSNSGASWTENTAARSGSDGSLSAAWYDTKNASTFYVASVSTDASKNHLWKTTNGGTSFSAIDNESTGFPLGVAVHVIENNPTDSSDLFAGTDLGVYRSKDGGATWNRYGSGQPWVAATDLYLAPDGSLLRVATFGRGVWEVALK